MTRRTWQDFWSDKTDPLPKENTDDFFRRNAEELKLLFLEAPLNRVLEIGCGSGELHERLGFDTVEYTGVDFSPSMLRTFAGRHPDAQLIRANAEDYRVEDGSYDLVFANAVVQYLDTDKLARLLDNVAAMLSPTGYVVLSEIPWKALRVPYYTGELVGERRGLVRSAYAIAHGLTRDQMGTWFRFADIAELARQHGLSSEVFGSMCYPYRFHVRLRRRT